MWQSGLAIFQETRGLHPLILLYFDYIIVVDNEDIKHKQVLSHEYLEKTSALYRSFYNNQTKRSTVQFFFKTKTVGHLKVEC